MKALILADQTAPALFPLTSRTALCLLPIAGKPLIEHTLEDLIRAGVREFLVVVSPHAEKVVEHLGSGERWGVKIETTLSRGDETPGAVLKRSPDRLSPPFLIVCGDVLRSHHTAEFLEAAKTTDGGRGNVISARSEGQRMGLYLVPGEEALKAVCAQDAAGAQWPEGSDDVDIPGAVAIPIDSLSSFHRANLEAAKEAVPGLLLPARKIAVGVHVGRRTRLSLKAAKEWPVFVASRCSIHPEAELLAGTVISDDVVVDRQATLKSTVVLPFTYIGELVELENAIVWSNDLIRVDTGTIMKVTDAFLLAGLDRTSTKSLPGGLLQRAAGLFLFLLSLPLWPLSLIASLLASPRKPFREVWLRGNRRSSRPGPAREDLRVFEGATRIPILRHLPRVLCVVSGHLSLVGVHPLTPEQDDALSTEWEILHRDAPAGLIGPVALTLSSDVPEEERILADSFYARTRSLSGDLVWVLQGIRAFFTSKAWKPLPRSASPED